MNLKPVKPEDGFAWITGAGKGLGRALTVRLVEAGWTVLASARTESDLEALADETRTFAGKLVPLPLDITNAAAMQVALDDAVRDQPLALAVLNAGTHVATDLSNFKPETVKMLVDTNLLGTLNCLYAVLPRMRSQRRGQIAVVGSMAGFLGLPSASVYGMTKAGLINLCEALQPELAVEGVHLQAVNPGFVRTPLTDKNTFPMPFLMELDAAARAFERGLASRRFEIVFPMRLAVIMKLLRCLPYALSLRITAQFLPGGTRDNG